MRKLWYLPLEKCPERYSYQLQDWSETRFKQRGVDYEIVLGDSLSEDTSIKVGQVLDAHGRCFFGLSQFMNVVKLMQNGHITGDDVIFSEDLFHPGYECLPYMLYQMPEKDRPKVYTRDLAQTSDIYDFTAKWKWMRHFEQMVFNTITGVLIEGAEFARLIKPCMYDTTAPLYLTGLPFDKNEVRSRVAEIKPLSKRTKRIVFTSRFDEEKQPGFFMDMVEKSRLTEMGYEFSILTGAKKLRSTNQVYVDRARAMEAQGLLTIHDGLSKDAYYELLADSIIQVNTALQDFRSNTLNEACALGTLPLYPAFRSFPDALYNERRNLYAPWSMEDAIEKLIYLAYHLDNTNNITERVADEGHACIDRTIDILTGNGEQYLYKGW